MVSDGWTEEIEEICEKLRINCVNLAEYHRNRYYHFKSYGKYFRIPQIILASVTSTASIGLQPLLEQGVISGITCVLGMIMGILSAIEIYMGISTAMEVELKQSKDFYTLSIDLFKTLSLKREVRGENGKDYLNQKYSQYIKQTESSNLLKRQLKVDLLTEIPKKYTDTFSRFGSGTPTIETPTSRKQIPRDFSMDKMTVEKDNGEPALFDIVVPEQLTRRSFSQNQVLDSSAGYISQTGIPMQSVQEVAKTDDDDDDQQEVIV